MGAAEPTLSASPTPPGPGLCPFSAANLSTPLPRWQPYQAPCWLPSWSPVRGDGSTPATEASLQPPLQHMPSSSMEYVHRPSPTPINGGGSNQPWELCSRSVDVFKLPFNLPASSAVTCTFNTHCGSGKTILRAAIAAMIE